MNTKFKVKAMYYKEQEIDGLLYFKNTPKGKWTPFTPKMYMERIKEAKESCNELREAYEGLSKAFEGLSEYYEAIHF